jgi:hypothetical protein
MKHFIFLCAAIGSIFTLHSCGDQAKQVQAAQTDTTATKLAKAPCDARTSNVISLDSAIMLIYNFVSSEKGSKFVSKYGIGSYITFKTLSEKFGFTDKNNDATMGIFFYDCIYKRDALFAMRKDKNCHKEYRTSYTINDAAYYDITSLSLVNFEATDIDTNDVRKYLKGQPISRRYLDTVYKPIPGSDVKEQNEALVTALGGEDFHTSHGYSFFNLTDFEKLKGSASIVGFAIFRGIEKIKEDGKDVEYDRIILIAVDKNGNFETDNNVILERSWPPRRLKDGTPN